MTDGYFQDQRTLCEEKWRALDDRLAAAGIGTLVVGDLADVRYLTGYLPYLVLAQQLGQYCVYLAGHGRPILYPRPSYVTMAERLLPWVDVRSPEGLGSDGFARDVMSAHELHATHGQSIGYAGLPQEWHREMESVAGPLLVDSAGLLAEARSKKTPAEIELIIRASVIAQEGMMVALRQLREERSECEVAAAAEAAMRRQGTESHAIVCRGRNASVLQEVATTDLCRSGDLVLIDLGCYLGGYRCEFARTGVVERSPSPSQLRMLEAVSKAAREAGEMLRPGVSGAMVSRAAREVISASGYEHSAHPHPTGHGLGVTGGEHPILTDTTAAVLEADMVIALEPGIFDPDRQIGIRIEDVWLIEQNGARLLTSSVPHLPEAVAESLS